MLLNLKRLRPIILVLAAVAIVFTWPRAEAEQIATPITFPDSCSLEAVVCKDEVRPDYETEKIIKVIAILETNYGKTGVGRSKNNLTGIRANGTYATFSSPEESISESVRIWEHNYARINAIDSQLAYWKTGNPRNREEATLRYISNFHALYDKI